MPQAVQIEPNAAVMKNPQSNDSVKVEEKPAEPSLFEKFGGDEKMTLFVDEIMT